MATLQASDLDAASRSDLIARAEALGIDKADVLTRAELIDEIVKRTVADPIERRLARGLLGVARDLVARVVERGLHLPDAAALIRGLQQVTLTPVTPPIATVTLAEIYAGQGHRARALAVLDEVLAKEPEHTAARSAPREGGQPHRTKRSRHPHPRNHRPPPPQPPTATSNPSATATPTTTATATANPTATSPPARTSTLQKRSPPATPCRPPPTRSPPSSPPAARPTATTRPTYFAPPPQLSMTTRNRPNRPAPPPLPSARRDRARQPDADRVVLVPVEATSALAYWEVWPAALDEARARARRGELILRVVAVTPSWDGPSAEVRDIEVGIPSGDWLVNDLPVGAVVRAAIGWRRDGGFDPLAVALDVAARGEEEKSAAAEAGAASSSHSDEPARRANIEDRARTRARQERSGRERGSSWRTLALAPWEAQYAPPAPSSIEAR